MAPAHYSYLVVNPTTQLLIVSFEEVPDTLLAHAIPRMASSTSSTLLWPFLPACAVTAWVVGPYSSRLVLVSRDPQDTHTTG